MRTIFVFVLSLAAYHWMLDEIRLISPSAASYAREMAEKIRIPTHNRWPTAELASFVRGEVEFTEFLQESWITLTAEHPATGSDREGLSSPKHV